ncbi:MAG: hypothetical protein NC936_04975 [Candidatus Omnitrophica bacterium]|nr:hypothetical protein [Candidatus Omnitrophota bacterium]
MKFKIVIYLFLLIIIVNSLVGCEALVRKFSRKPKEKKPEEIVLVPEDYKGSMTPEERYRQYFLFWKSWQDELIQSLIEKRSLKKRVDCAEQAIKNLKELKKLLSSQEKQKLLAKYIQQLEQLKSMISQDTYGNNINQHREKADSIKRNVVRFFTYSEVKEFVE